jgi:hypothetical protein
MTKDVIGDIIMYGVDHQGRFKADRLSPNTKVAFDISNVAAFTVLRLLDYCICIPLKRLHKASLSAGGGRLDCIEPEPDPSNQLLPCHVREPSKISWGPRQARRGISVL